MRNKGDGSLSLASDFLELTHNQIFMTTIYGIKNCDTMKKAFTFLDNKGIEYEFVDVKKEPLSREEIARFAYLVGIDTLVNRKGTTWRKLEIGDKELSDDELIDLLQEHQTMIKRPVLEHDDSVMVGFDEDAYEHLFSEEEED